MTRCRINLLTVPQPDAVPHPTTVLDLVVIVGAPNVPFGVIVSILSVTRVLVPGSVAVIVSVWVMVAPGSRGVVVLNTPEVLSTPEVMIPVVFTPGG